MSYQSAAIDRYISRNAPILATVLCATLLMNATVALANTRFVTLQKSEFRLPSQGVLNNGGTIGDFCCAGRTATIRATGGRPVGYIYFYVFRGGVNYADGKSGMTDVGLRLSAIQSPINPSAARSQSAIWFSADEIRRGVRRKTRKVGALIFEVTVGRAKFRGNRILMRPFAVLVEVKVDKTVTADPKVAQQLRDAGQYGRDPRTGRIRERLRPIDRARLTASRQCVNPAIVSLNAVIVHMNTDCVTGAVELRAGLKNVGNADYVSRPGQQKVYFSNGRRQIDSRSFATLRKDEQRTITARLTWRTNHEFQEPLKARIVYDPDIRLDGNPRNDDCNRSDNSRTLQPAEINRLFAERCRRR